MTTDCRPKTAHVPALDADDAAAFWREACARRQERPVTPWDEGERDVLREFNRAAGAPEDVLARIDLLGDPRTLVVATGQQPGLFLSPLYIIYKAIAAIKWAERLERILGRPVVPIFWIASDDHDFEEIRHADYLTREGALGRWTYGAADAPDNVHARSIFDIPYDRSALQGFLDEIAANSAVSEHRDPHLDRWRGIVDAAGNLEDLFARLLMDLLGTHGLVLLPARLAPLRRRGAAIMRQEIENAGETSAIIRAAGERLKAAGETVPIHRQGNEANFFLYRGTLRCKVTIDGDEFVASHPISGETVDRVFRNALLAELEQSPEHFSPNVATRPLVQDTALPTIAMVGGPGERKYLAQLGEVYDRFGVPRPTVLARPRALLVEPRIERQLRKHNVSRDDLQGERWQAIEQSFLSEGHFGRALEEAQALHDTHKAAFSRLSESLGELARNPAIASAIEKTSQNCARAIEMLQERVRREVGRMGEAEGGHLQRILTALHPNGQAQERELGPLAPFLLNHGARFVPWLIESLSLDSEAVQVLYLSECV